jgi:ectoine hydroxylase-related dioxygenase (phytanoyl-CoA dioxygenase family)
MGQAMLGFEDSTPLLDDAEALVGRFERDGYLLLRGVVDRAVLLDVRRAITDVLAAHGWLDPAHNTMLARPQAGPYGEGEPEYLEAYDDIQRLECFHAVPHHESVRRCVTALMGETAFPHPLSIARLMFPDNTEWTTPQHQDYPNNQGTTELYACWIPLSDCSPEDGNLTILRGSHVHGVAPLRAALGAGNRKAELGPQYDDLDWVGGELRLGDMLVFHSLTVHRSLPNHGRAMRLSVDYRFQREGDSLTEGCLRPHFGRLSWDDIYAGWDRDDLKHYWRDKDYVVVDWDSSLHEISEDEFVELIREWARWRRRHPKGDPSTVDMGRWKGPEKLPPIDGVRPTTQPREEQPTTT